MSKDLIFLPVLIQVLLTIKQYILLLIAKKKAVAAGEVDLERRGLYDDAWPVSVIKINNSIRSQYEIPVLFYVLVGILWALDAIGPIAHALAWVFVLSRFAHAYIHTGSNFVPHRLRFFSLGVFSVILLALLAIYRLIG